MYQKSDTPSHIFTPKFISHSWPSWMFIWKTMASPSPAGKSQLMQSLLGDQLRKPLVASVDSCSGSESPVSSKHLQTHLGFSPTMRRSLKTGTSTRKWWTTIWFGGTRIEYYKLKLSPESIGMTPPCKGTGAQRRRWPEQGGQLLGRSPLHIGLSRNRVHSKKIQKDNVEGKTMINDDK